MSDKKCGNCGHKPEYMSDLKQGWTNDIYCSESCERDAVSRLHGSMPGGKLPRAGWLPHHVECEISRRWAE